MIKKWGWNILVFLIIGNAWLNNHAFSTFQVANAEQNQNVADEIQEKSKQIEELEKQIQDLQSQIDKKQGESKTLQNEISKFDSQIKQVQLEIRRIQLSVNQVAGEITKTSDEIKEAEEKIEKQRTALGQTIRLLYEKGDENLTEIIFKYSNLSDFFSNLNAIENTQENLKLSIQEIRTLKVQLEDTEVILQNKKTELESYKSIQEIEKKYLDSAKKEKDSLLKNTKGQESKFQKLVQQSKFDIERIKEQVYFLQQNGISVEDAVKFGQLAAIRIGIRPAFLIAILEIESGLGKNVGTGNWMDDMYKCYLRLGKPSRAETEKKAFLTIISKLGLDPNSIKVSREPNYGCGGALGPAQFLPSTWLAYEEEVSRLTGHNPPNPWVIEDAFMAAAVKLSRGGANQGTKTGEVRAAKAYISGNPVCTSSICNYYSNAVQRKAEQIEKNL